MRQLPAAVALCLVTGVAAAQELAPLNDLRACRLDHDLVALSFSYEGGACEETGNPSVDLVESGTATVTVPVVPTAEVCTMNVVNVESSSAVAVVEEVTALDVQLVSPSGEVAAEGRVEIAPKSADCVPPKGPE